MTNLIGAFRDYANVPNKITNIFWKWLLSLPTDFRKQAGQSEENNSNPLWEYPVKWLGITLGTARTEV